MKNEDELVDTLCLRLMRSVEIVRIGGTVGRTTVYRVNDGEFVLKVFHHAPHIKQRRELTAYAFLSAADLPVARLLNSGVLSSGVPWILMSYITGTPVSETKNRVPDTLAQMTGVIARIVGMRHEGSARLGVRCVHQLMQEQP